MSFLSALYTLIISPLELLFEVIFTIANRIIGNEGFALIFLSIAVQFLILPLYKRADELQAEERDIQAKMSSWIKHIKSTFKGDERFMMLQEYYRINNYKPIYALKSSISLLLQIPFFVAAYHLLSGMQRLQGTPFGFISDLGKEDALFMIGKFPVNILPILMTLINIISGIIYTKGHPLKAKVQTYGLAIIFLVLLYRSPSGLVLYWLMNNIFSLAKNIFFKLKEPKKLLNIILALSGATIFLLTVIRSDLDLRQKLLLAIGCILLILPLILYRFKAKTFTKPSTKDSFAFFSGAVFMASVTGLLIPSTVINASAEEFLDIVLRSNPVMYIINSMLLSFGCWVLWGGVFYFFMSDKAKSVFSKVIWLVCGISIVDYLLFGTNLGVMKSTLQYEITPKFSLAEYLLNSFVVLVVGIALLFFYSKLHKFIKYTLIIGILTVVGIGLMNTGLIWEIYSSYIKFNSYMGDTVTYEKPTIPLSKNGKNVVVIMLDRAMGTQVPYIFNEKPELLEKYDGFTYYPNTISYGVHTIYGSPALYGGYDYTPERINERDTESLVSKQNEALKVMPVIFGENGYTITICDPSFAGYKLLPDLSIYDEYPDFNCYNINGTFNYFEDSDNGETTIKLSLRVSELRNRNFFCFSLMKISPLLFQKTIYGDGYYNEAISVSENMQEAGDFSILYQKIDGISKGTGYSLDFINAYAVLANLSNITTITENSNNTFLMMSNDTAHSPCLLQEPDYIPAIWVDNTSYDTDMISRYTVNGITMQMNNDFQVSHYHANMATYLKLGEWFDYLRENGVYDNTRIILVADHGRDLGQFDVMCHDTDMEFFMPLLMVKDFNASGFTVCEDFMTNGDTPAIATSGIIDDPVNPFTGNPINSKKKEGAQSVFLSPELLINGKNTTFLPGSWYTFTGGDIHDPDNWTYLGDY